MHSIHSATLNKTNVPRIFIIRDIFVWKWCGPGLERYGMDYMNMKGNLEKIFRVFFSFEFVSFSISMFIENVEVEMLDCMPYLIFKMASSFARI